MDIENRVFLNEDFKGVPGGVLILPLHPPRYAHLLHSTFRQHRRSKGGPVRSHAHDVYHIILVTGGLGHFQVGEHLHHARPGELHITSPSEWHNFGDAPDQHVEYCEVTFEFRDLAGGVLTRPFHEVLSLWTGRPCRPVTHATVPADLNFLIMREVEQLVREGFSRPRDLDLVLNESLARIFMGLYTHLFREQVALPADPMVPVREYIHKRYSEHLTLSGLAALCGFSTNYLSRRFKALYGATPIVYQHRLRIQAASVLLCTTEYPIKQIAEIVGFNDVYFFSRVFKKIQREPPGRYRKKMQATKE